MNDPKSATDQAAEKSAAELIYWRAREAWTDAQFLAEYCQQQRQQAKGSADMIERHLASEKEIEAYVKKYGTDEG